MTRPTLGGIGWRVARGFASPVGVLVTLPLLVVLVGVGILLLGRDATRTSSQAMARHQLADRLSNVRSDVAFALDQAEPLLARIRLLADRELPLAQALVRLHDLLIGRPGVAFLSISFPDGTFRGASLTPEGAITVQESTVGNHDVRHYAVDDGALRLTKTEDSTYNPHTRGFYQLAQHTHTRAWTPPYMFFRTHQTGITCTEPLYDSAGALRAVLTVDFDVGALSRFVARPALDEARSFVFSGDGTMLASPASAPTKDTLLRHEDLRDPALDALFAAPRRAGPTIEQLELATADGEYLAAVASIGGQRAGVAVPLDWYVATVIPTRTLLGPTHALERSSIAASASALAIAFGLALVLAWNLLRMRRQVAASREDTRSAEARARELGSYRLVGRLGTGAMGEVWRAEHRLLARSAAIKLIRPEALHDPGSSSEIRERFRREAQTLASMKSRYTIAIYDYGVTAEGVFYYVMELLDGLDLESLVDRYGAQPPARVIRMLIQACGSLGEAHEAGLLHRDIKPPNLFVSRAADEVDITKLLDFGIVQTLHEPPAPAAQPSTMSTPKLTQLDSILGTPGFMAPEQILGMQLDGRADLYSLGCCAWWLLAGGELFDREDGDSELLQHHIATPVPSLRTVVRGWCPAELETVIAACLAKEPQDRPRDAHALAELLRAIPIPDAYAWTDARAAAWWHDYEPSTPEPAVPTSEIQLIVGARMADGNEPDNEPL